MSPYNGGLYMWLQNVNGVHLCSSTMLSKPYMQPYNAKCTVFLVHMLYMTTYVNCISIGRIYGSMHCIIKHWFECSIVVFLLHEIWAVFGLSSAFSTVGSQSRPHGIGISQHSLRPLILFTVKLLFN